MEEFEKTTIKENLASIIDLAMEQESSDIHLTIGIPPRLRTSGRIHQPEGFEVNSAETTWDFTKQLLTADKMEDFKTKKNADSSISYKDIRLRVHVFQQNGAPAIVLRLIPKTIPDFKTLGLPPVIRSFTNLHNGLVLITGITGSGKSTTLATLINEINKNQSKHIVTIEDPVEFVHNHKNSIINQREVGKDVLDFPSATRAAMREDPDILLIGEMRDLETVQNAVTLAETGHLVFGTLHTKSAVESVSRIIDMFPPEQQQQIRTQLALSIKAVVSQSLLPKVGGGRVASAEIMIVNNAIKSIIRENGNISGLVDQIQLNSSTLQSQTTIQSLANLVVSKQISMETAQDGLNSDDLALLKNTIVQVSIMKDSNEDEEEYDY